jgi:TonB family protein
VAPPPELPRATLPPPIKTGEFAQVIRPAPKPSRQLSLEGSAFTSQENVHTVVPRVPLIPEPAGFDNTAPVKEAPKRAVLSEGGFSGGGFSGVSSAPNQASPQRVVTQGRFADAAGPAPAPGTRNSAPASLTKPVEILSKTRPAYTPEARALGIQGEVLVEVVFEAARSVRVVRLVKGLGHGLDEKALEAAREIQFRPATREGVPSDTTAVVHILFQLAD